MNGPEHDPVVNELREQISELDRSIFDAVNRRLALVAQLKKHKDAHGYSFVDPGREAEMIAAQIAANPGPLSPDGVRALYAELLALTKREVG
jgi:chorismate mutase / prephenate dehydratase